MAWIRERRRKDGGITYVVTWREPGATKESTLSIKDDLARAEMNVRLLEANDNSFEAAQRAHAHAQIDGPTVSQSITKHVELLTRAGPDQIKRYRSAIKNHFGGRLGKIPVSAVEHEDIVLWIKYMQDKNLSPKTIANHHGLLSAAMETAVRLKARPDNPCRGVKLPSDDSTEEKMHFMTADESLRIVRAAPARYQAFLAFLRATGTRFGEATALRGSDFRLDAKPPTVRIERAWKRGDDNRFYLGPPKTKKSRRSVSLPPSLVAEIRHLVEGADPEGFVFSTSYGGPIRHSTFHEFWKDALDSLKYPKGRGNRPRIHDLRHTHASLMLGGGMPIYELSRRLGHEGIQTTIDRYSHLVPDAQFRGADIAEKALEVGDAAEIVA